MPATLRLLIWLTSSNRSIDPLSAVDFILFGLVLQISNINEMEHFDGYASSWKTITNVVAICFITLYGGLYATYLIEGATVELLVASITMGILSFLISLIVHTRTAGNKEREDA